MSTLLYRLGSLAYRARGRVLMIWLLVLVAVGALLALNPPQTSTSFSIPGTASQAVMDKLENEIPSSSGTSVSVVFEAPEGQRVDTAQRTEAIQQVVKDVHTSDYVVKERASDGGGKVDADLQKALTPAGDVTMQPLMTGKGADATVVDGVTVSTNGRVAMLQFQLTDNPMSLPEGATDAIVASADKAHDAGLTVLPSSDLTQKMESPMGAKEIVGLVIAAIVLLITLGSLRLAGMPLLTAIVGVGVGVGSAYALSSVIDMTSMTPILALMIGLAVGIDYALFITNRARRLILDKGLAAHEAVGRAVGTAGSAVFFAGLTVVVSLSGLSIIGISFLTTMALVAAGTVVIAVLVALTLLPALLGFVGERLVTPKQREKNAAKAAAHPEGVTHGPATRWAQGIAKRPGWVTVGVVVVLAALAVPFTKMDLNLPSSGTANTGTVERQSYDAVTAGFGEGFNGPLLVVASGDDALGAQGITSVKEALAGVDHVTAVIPGAISEDGRTATFTVVPDAGPTADSTIDLVHALRAPALASTAGADLGVTGVTAMNIDMSKVLSDALVPYIAIIVVISLVILLLVFRSIYVPVTATLGFVLTIGASLGATTALFQWGWLKDLFGFDTAGPVLSFLPIIVTGILYGLAMDYQMFLVSSMRESHVHGHPGVAGVVDGFRGAARVVVAAAIIMISVFSGFIFGDDTMIKQIGFSLAFGILIDAFVVRMTLIPAVMALAGEKAWWLPKWLDKILPNLDVEGDKLVKRLEAKAAQAEKEPVGASA
ncbi:MMPL family transporter [Luteimicrobium sp. NPDC057192]|uniref:MMPL family transporter n=1 Tax=Luteimicrobium sp. NPDC057192 TaxID=3346042 RepID=UPI00364400C2